MTSCIQELDGILIDNTPKLVVECYLNPAEPEITVTVNRNRGIQGDGSGDKSTINPVKNASVTLSYATQAVSLVNESTSNLYRIQASKFRLVPGRSYTLKVSAPGLPAIRAVCTIPRPVGSLTNKDAGVSFIAVDSSRSSYQAYRRRTLSWTKSQITLPDYYLLGYGQGTPYAFNNGRKDTAIVVLRDTRVLSFLKDTRQAGSYTSSPLDYYIGSAKKPAEASLIRKPSMYSFVYHTDENYYRFFESIKLQREVGDNPFAEAVPIYTNIWGGLGVFGACVIQVKELR
jgi:hypothetical protein